MVTGKLILTRNYAQTTSENCLSVNDLVLLGFGVDVPQADGVVVRGGQEVAIQVRVP